MHEVYEGLRSKLSMSLKELNKTGKLSGAALNELHMVTDTIKNLDKIEMLEEDGGYSEATDFMGEGRMYGTSYARGRRGNVRRDNMGRYSRGDGYDTTRRYSRNDGYSYGDGKEDMMEELEEMMQNADGSSREAIRRCMEEIKRT
ncbi:MAG: hypothetical protein U0K91_11085 [Acutalibacteraceae bacterium]|nr:hypothetical protein [Acutalibacteraceae bacterium]